jgi:hypothetical protein
MTTSNSCDGWQHVGWKFTSLNDNNNNYNPAAIDHFYALMVELEQKEKVQGLKVGGFKAPGWMIAAIRS